VNDGETLLTVGVPLAPGAYFRRPRRPLPFPLGESNCRLYAQARQGLWHALAAVGLRAGDEVLAPAYHHGSEIETLTRAGLICRFYDGVGTIEPSEPELDELTGPRVRALYLIHPLGYPQDSLRWRRWCDDRGLLLIEDGAQSWLSARDGRPVGELADIALFCLYKAVPVPDGGAVTCRCPSPRPTARTRTGIRGVLRAHALWLAQRRREAAQRIRGPWHWHEVEERPELHFALSHTDQPPLLATRALISRVSGPSAPARRVANYRHLEARLGDLRAPAFPPLPGGASPFAFPVEVDHKRDVVAALAARGIVGTQLWMVPHPSLPVARHPAAAALRERLVALPVHQELRRRDLDRIASAVRCATAAPTGRRSPPLPVPQPKDLS
jgi:dTDP-4-amino-4,6-dideoxygalactose transaminase